MKPIVRITVPAVLAAGLLAAAGAAVAGSYGERQGGMGYGSGMGPGMGAMMTEDCPMGGMGMGRHGDRMMMSPGAMHRLDLDEDQRERMREMRREQMVEHAERQARMLELREDMDALLREEQPDPDAVEDLHARMAEHHGRMLADRVRMRNAMHDLMTDEQRERMREMRQRGDRGMGMHRGQGQGQRGMGMQDQQ